MAKSRPEAQARLAQERIARIRAALAEINTYLCSGTLLERMKTCGKTTCRCAEDPAARHGPYYEWGHMKGGKLVHRLVTAKQAEILTIAIANNRAVKKLIRAWETETEHLIDAVPTDRP